VADIQRDAGALTTAIGSGTGSSQISALNADIAKIAADIAAGTSASSDISTALTDMTNLTTALASTNTTPQVQHMAHDLGNDLMELAIEEAALTV
jgi:hypothetical protein